MSEIRLALRWLLPSVVILLLPVIDESHSANVDKVVIVMPKGPRTLQMLGSISPQLLHTISDVLKPVPSNVVQIPVPYYPDGPKYPPPKKHHHHHHTKHTPKHVSDAYFRHPFKPAPSYVTLNLEDTQPGPYDTPFVPMLKPSPVNPLHLEHPPEIKFTPINLLPNEPPSFSTVRNYVQKLKEKQKAFFDNQGYDFGFSSLPPPPPKKYHSPYTKSPDYTKTYEYTKTPDFTKTLDFTKPYEYKKKPQKHKYSKPINDYLFSSHPNELSYIGQANLKPQEEQNVYYTEPDAGQNYYYADAEGHEFVIPPESDFQPLVEIDGIIDPDDAHFEQKGEELVLKTKHPNAAVLTPAELSSFSEQAEEYGFAILHESKRKRDDEKKVTTSDVHHRNKRFKKIDRVGRASGDQDVEEDFYDSDEAKKKKSSGEPDFDDVEEEVKAMVNFEPKKTYVQVRHEETNSKKSRPAEEPKIKEKVTISKTNIVYSEKGKESESFDHGKEESFGEFQAKSKKPKKHRGKRDVSAVEQEVTTTTAAPSASASDESASQSVEESFEQNNSLENEVDYELWPEAEGQHNDSDTIFLPYAQALVFQNDSDLILLPIPEALVDPRELQGDDLLNFLDEAIHNSTQFLPEENEKKRVLISPEIRQLQGQDLIKYLDEAIKTSNQYLSGPGDAIELVSPPKLDNVLPPEPLTKPSADHEIEMSPDVPKPEEVHSEVHRYMRHYLLPDVPLYEEVNFVQPFNTLIKYHSEHEPEDYEIEIEAQNPRELHGDELLRYLDEALDNTTYVIPEEYEQQERGLSPYLNRAQHYGIDVDTALQFAENVTNQLADYLQARNNYKQNEVLPERGQEETVLVSDGGFVPIRRADPTAGNVQFSSSKQAELVGVKDTFNGTPQQKQSNPGVVVYNDVIRHIKNHLSSSGGPGAAKTKDRTMLMIAVPRSLRQNITRQGAARRQDSVFDTLPKASFIQLPIFDINKFYPTFNVGEPSSSVKQAVEKEAEKVVTSGSDQTTHENKPTPKVRSHDDIADAFRDVKRKAGRPRYGPNAYIPVQEKTRDFPQPTFKKPGPPYTALPVPPINHKAKANNLNTASSGQRSLLSHPPPQHPPLKRPRGHGKRPHHKTFKRVPVVRKKVRIIKR
ncbi:uncharacterized protein LOC120427558 [Culex pipiens pallens]|uniref:uncharacterized protein LOC120427558 n=1 Tax=Culex pipiens pallens TaxID=42434 RepID=UPI00195496FD|nr:uncharacterized protein LOC120427558 [Culex pipiens pallens]